MANRPYQPVADRRPAVLMRADAPENQAAYAIACEARGLREGLARWDDRLGGWAPRHPSVRARAVATLLTGPAWSDSAA